MTQKHVEDYITKRDRILRYLLLNCSSSDEGCTLREISSAVMLSPTGARHYLTNLENQGFIFHSEIQGRAGRPAMTYSLTRKGLDSFPKAYIEFSVNLLEEINNQMGVKKTIELLEAVGRKRAARIKDILKEPIGMYKSNASLKKGLKEIVDIFEEYGKFPQLLENDDSFLLKNYNCLFFEIAMQEPLVCRVTETIMAEITNGMAIKEKCIRDGDGACLYRFKKYNKTTTLQEL